MGSRIKLPQTRDLESDVRTSVTHNKQQHELCLPVEGGATQCAECLESPTRPPAPEFEGKTSSRVCVLAKL